MSLTKVLKICYIRTPVVFFKYCSRFTWCHVECILSAKIVRYGTSSVKVVGFDSQLRQVDLLKCLEIMEARLSQTYGHKCWCVILSAEKHIWTLDKCQQEDNRYCYEMKNLVKVIVLGPWESLLAATILFRFMWLFLTLSTFFCSPFSSFIMLVVFTFPMSVHSSIFWLHFC